MTKRTAIESFREELRERSADSRYSNQFLYNELIKHAKWLIKREISRIYLNNSFFQTYSCEEIIEVSVVDACCPVKTNCKIYRTKHKLPELWIDNNGPIIKSIRSVDNSTTFIYTDTLTWQAKSNDPYHKLGSAKYTFYADGYLWFPEHNPHYVNIFGFFTDDVTKCKEDECIRFLDTKFMIPDWLEAEMFAKALEQMVNVTKKLQDDEQIDKNVNRKN